MVRCAGVLDDPRFDVTLFDASPGLLHNAHAYFTRTMPTLQAMQDDLLPARHLGRFDCVISFAAAHCVTIRARRSGSRQRCWRSMAACCSPTCCAIRRCALVAGVTGDASLPRLFAPDALASAAHAALRWMIRGAGARLPLPASTRAVSANRSRKRHWPTGCATGCPTRCVPMRCGASRAGRSTRTARSTGERWAMRSHGRSATPGRTRCVRAGRRAATLLACWERALAARRMRVTRRSSHSAATACSRRACSRSCASGSACGWDGGVLPAADARGSRRAARRGRTGRAALAAAGDAPVATIEEGVL